MSCSDVRCPKRGGKDEIKWWRWGRTKRFLNEAKCKEGWKEYRE